MGETLPPIARPACSPGRGLLGRCARWGRRLLDRRSLAVLVLLGLLGLSGWLLGPACLAEYHLRAARRAADRYHNLQAQDHLQRCLDIRPRNPRALLLAARVARRVGSFAIAEGWLEQYQELRSADEELVLERV